MTDEQPEQWAVDIAASLGLYSDVSVRTIVRAFANRHGDLVAAKVAFAEREAELVADNAKLREANMRLRNGYADSVSGLNYIIQTHGRLPGVGFDRVLDHFAEWVTIPEREGLQAGSHTLAALKSREAGHG